MIRIVRDLIADSRGVTRTVPPGSEQRRKQAFRILREFLEIADLAAKRLQSPRSRIFGLLARFSNDLRPVRALIDSCFFPETISQLGNFTKGLIGAS